MSKVREHITDSIAGMNAAWDALRNITAADGAVLHNEVMRVCGLLASALSAVLTLDYALEADAKAAAVEKGGAA